MGNIQQSGLYSAFLSKQDTDNLKGIFVCMVLISHLSARVGLFSNSLLGTMFSACGYLAVAGFFFVSGYGLYMGYREKEGYIHVFPKKKILPFYVMCVSVIFIYFLRDLLTGGVAWLDLVKSFFFGGTVVDMGWYLQAQLVLYFAFYFAFRCSKHGIRWVTVFTALYCGICILLKFSTTWYESVACFVFGLLCAKYRNDIVGFLESKKRTIISAGLLAAAFIVTLFLGNKPILPDVLRVPVKMLSACCFVAFAVSACSRIHIPGPVLSFLGKRSFAAYVIQGMFLNGYRPVIENDWWYMLAVTGSVLAAAVVMQPVFNRISKRIASM